MHFPKKYGPPQLETNLDQQSERHWRLCLTQLHIRFKL